MATPTKSIALTVDIVLFTIIRKQIHLLLIKRKHPPFQGAWALPGGFVEVGEPLAVAASRELTEETSVRDIALEQLQTVGEPHRDPRGHTVSVIYLGLVPHDRLDICAGDDAADASLFPLRANLPLAFDHRQIIDDAIEFLKDRCWSVHGAWKTLQRLLPDLFTLKQLQETYEAIVERQVDKRNFRRKATHSGYLVETDIRQEKVRHRPARLYKLTTMKQK